ncbi:hypothetical protein T02_3015, partial [Trichinella nativa]
MHENGNRKIKTTRINIAKESEYGKSNDINRKIMLKKNINNQ